MIESEARKKAAKVQGIVRPRPSSSLTFFLWVATRMAPAQKKRVILPAACIAICMPPARTPVAVAIAAPRTM